MKRVLRVYSDGQEEIVVIRDKTRREFNWPLVLGASISIAMWVVAIWWHG